ncbi:MAG: hypothetical protein SFV18_00390 [Bryobacteraceae bacterium]|nr:hypothetical protein [Bryobacteraceae bacterium]
MKQFNMNVDREFERDLKRVMKLRGIKRKADTVRTLVKEAAASEGPPNGDKPWQKYDWDKLLGAALRYPENPNPRFLNEDDLWS